MIRKIGLALAFAVLATPSFAEDATQFGDKLGFMPVANTNRPMIGGTGEVSAALEGNKLTISGEFSGLRGKAQAILVHSAPPGQVGPEVARFDIEGGANAGSFSNELELNDEQLALLQANSMYVVVLTDRNDKGELRGWLMARKGE